MEVRCALGMQDRVHQMVQGMIPAPARAPAEIKPLAQGQGSSLHYFQILVHGADGHAMGTAVDDFAVLVEVDVEEAGDAAVVFQDVVVGRFRQNLMRAIIDLQAAPFGCRTCATTGVRSATVSWFLSMRSPTDPRLNTGLTEK
jgi:hypothetical protein